VIPEKGSVNEYRSERLLYRITLKLPDAAVLDPGRVVSVRITRQERLYKKVLQFLFSAFRREF